MNDYKKIVLLKGLESMDDYHFRIIKSLLKRDLHLSENMQNDYDRIKIADKMEETFPKDSGLNKLIEICQEIKDLRGLVENLKEEKAKVKGKKPTGKKRQKADSAVPTSTTSNTLASDGGETSTAQVSLGDSGGLAAYRGSAICPYSVHQKRKSVNEEKPEVKKTKKSKGSDCPDSPGEATVRCQTPGPQISSSTSSNPSLAKNQKTQTPSQSTNRGAVGQNDAMIVMVLNAEEPFEYESREPGGKMMFHATVASMNEYFHVKVFNIKLKEKFTKGNVIIISNYVKFRGIIEIKADSYVIKAEPNEKIEVPKKIISKANETPMISDIHKSVGGTLFYGLFTLHKKKFNPKNTIYEIKDDTGSIEVLGSGKCYNISCEIGDKLRLFCFQLKTMDGQPKLVSGNHSFIKVRITKAGKKKMSALHPNPKDEEASGYPQNSFSAFNSEAFKIETPNNWK
ncbi:interferon-activable protein 205-B-like [Chionomys nivalis]|uniref:interferon-activable protein 205-B-like n=1 Tax=Chionomys nivalis TaxID=269649 RepID=UPI002598F385|nr:interferon-activable protein 205-B-like [Chionomys nivalis]